MARDFVLEEYISAGVEDIVKGVLRATLSDPRESAFMLRYAAASRKAAGIRNRYEAKGEHIPPFLIASIASRCNLHCTGCYARANQACADSEDPDQMTGDEWKNLFLEARDLGVGFILLAGGEPMLRRDVLDAAAEIPEILFPVFTNGTMVTDSALALFDRARNLVPVFSIEGDRAVTDHRRGQSVFDRMILAMDAIKERGLIFGASVTVTKENLGNIVERQFLDGLRDQGCKAVFFVEYVPVTPESRDLAPEDAERQFLADQLASLREQYPEMLLISFPGDEDASGGCLAAGRGFFHINAYGGAEPCPFSPYSDASVRKGGLLSAMHSRLFTSLRDGALLTGPHSGGCVLFEQKDRVEELLGVPKPERNQ